MKKKKLLVPLAVMTLSCGLCAGLLTGCGEHEHDYTEWAHDDTGHWQICVEDNETSEKEPHSWGADDRCECGAEKPAYGTASGNVKLLKMGEYVNDFTGVTIDPGEDDGIEISDVDPATGAFTVSNARAGKKYKFTISKEGYLETYVNLQAIKNQNVALGDCTLSYDAFTHAYHEAKPNVPNENWSAYYGDPSKIDKTHVNDAENPYFKIGEDTGDFYVYSKEKYDTVTAAVTYQRGDTNDITDLIDKKPAPGNQGLRLVFDDGKAVMIRIEKINLNPTDEHYAELHGKFKAQWILGGDWLETPVVTTGGWDFGNDEAHFMPFSDELVEQYEDTGVELKLVRNGGVVGAYVNGQFMGEQVLPEEYAGQKCRVSFAAARVKAGAEIPFSIQKEIPATETEKFDSALTFNKSGLLEGVTATLDKESGYKRGDLVTLTIDADAEKFVIKSIKLDEKELLGNYADGKVSFMLTEKTGHTLTVTTEEIKYVEKLENVSVIGKKYDVTGSNVKDATILLKGQGGLKDVELTVQNGTFSTGKIAQGTYSAELEGYKPATVVIGADGIEGNTITLEYDGFTFLEAFNHESHDFTNANAAVPSETDAPSIKYTGNEENAALNVLTKDSFKDVAASLRIKFDNSTNNMHTQGIVLKFEDGKHLVVRYHNGDVANGNIQYVNSAWDGCPANKTLFGADAGLNQWGEAPIHTLLNEETTAIKGDGLYLTCVLKNGRLYTFFDGKWVGTYTLPNGYEGKNVQIGFFSWNTAQNSVTEFKITGDETAFPDLSSGAIQINESVPENAEQAGIKIEKDKTAYTLGETVTLTVTLPQGYFVEAITLNDNSVINQMKRGEGTLTFTFMATAEVNTVAVTVKEIKTAGLEVDVTGKKFGVTENSLEGKEITLKGQGGLEDITLTVTEGKIKKDVIAQGTYTAEVKGITGYNSFEVTVGASGIETPIVFEYDSFYALHADWGSVNFSQQNDPTAKLTATNDCQYFLTNDTYGNVMFSVLLGGENARTGGDQGIYFRLKGDRIDDFVCIRMQGKGKIQFCYKCDNMGGNNAEGTDWQDLIFFNDGDEYLQAYAAGTLKLSVVREGASFFVFLGDKYIGRRTFNAKYENVPAQVGIYYEGLPKGTNMTWTVAMTETLPNLLTSVTNGTTDTNGTVEISTATPKYGNAVTITLTPAAGYGIKSLKIGETTVTGPFTYRNGKAGTYSFTVTAATTIVAEFEPLTVTYANVDVQISGKKGTETINLNGATAVLSNDTAIYEVAVAEGKLTRNDVLPGTYTLKAEGYLSQTVTVTDSGIADAIVLVYNIFTSEPASADLSELNGSKVTATGKGGVDLETKEKYVNVTAEAEFDLVGDYATTQRRYSIALKFNDGKVFRVDLDLHDGDGKHYVQQPQWDTMMGFNWEGIKTYEAEQVAAFENGKVKYKIERNGASVKITINGEEIKTYTLPDAYKDQEVQLKFIFDSDKTDGTESFTFNITVPEAGVEQA